MRSFGLVIATLGVGLIVVAVVQYVTGFLGDALSWAALLGAFGVIFIGLGAALAVSDRD
jgi:hydrogenase-4 membrane subunit HyfE